MNKQTFSIGDIIDNVTDELDRALAYLKDLKSNNIIEGDDTLDELTNDITADRDRLCQVAEYLYQIDIINEELEID